MAVPTAKKATAPAAKAAPAEKKADSPLAALDFGAMTVTDVKATEIKHTRGSQLDSTPILGWLRESFEADQAKAIQVGSQEQAKALETLLRSGAARMKIGVKIVTTKSGDGYAVKFLAKERRDYKPRKKAAEKAAEKS